MTTKVQKKKKSSKKVSDVIMTRICVCYDGTPAAHAAFKKAVQDAKHTDNAIFHIIFAVEELSLPTLNFLDDPMLVMIEQNTESFRRAKEERLEAATKILQKLTEEAERLHPGLSCQTHLLLSNDLHKDILDLIIKLDPATVYVGTRGLGPIQAFFSSFSAWLVAHAPCNVMVVRDHPKTAKSE